MIKIRSAKGITTYLDLEELREGIVSETGYYGSGQGLDPVARILNEDMATSDAFEKYMDFKVEPAGDEFTKVAKNEA